MQAITNISVDILKVHPRNTEFFDDIQSDEYERFKRSIDEDGLLSPLVVAPDMTVISGHQRLKACRELGHKTVPVIIQEDVDDDDGKLRKLIVANFGRLKNDPIKQSKLIVEYEKLCGVQRGNNQHSLPNNSVSSQSDIAKQLGVTVDTIQNLKRLSTLSPDLQQIISDGSVTPTTGFKVLAKLSDDDQRELLSMLPAARKLTQAQVQEYVDKLKEKDNVIAGYRQKEQSKAEASQKAVQAKANELEQKYSGKISGLEAQIAKLQSEKSLLGKKVALNESEAEKYQKLKHDIEFLGQQKNDLSRKIDSATELSGLTVELQNLLEKKLAPIKFKRCMDVLDTSDVARQNLEDILEMLSGWLDEMRSACGADNIVAEVDFDIATVLPKKSRKLTHEETNAILRA